MGEPQRKAHVTSHEAAFDAVRFAAVVSVVGIHSLVKVKTAGLGQWSVVEPLWVLLWWAIPGLFLVSGFLQGKKAPRDDLSRMSARVRSLVFSYVGASILYWAYWWLRSQVGGETSRFVVSRFSYELVTGTVAPHLWFILVLAECMALDWSLRRWMPRPLVWTIVLAGAAFYVWAQAAQAFSAEALSLIYRSPAMWMLPFHMGVEYGRGLIGTPSRAAAVVAVVAGVTLSLAEPAVAVAVPLAGRTVLWTATLLSAWGIVFVTKSVLAEAKSGRRLMWLSRTSLATYIAHYAVLDVIAITATKFLGVPWTIFVAIAGWIVCAAVSLGIAGAWVRARSWLARA